MVPREEEEGNTFFTLLFLIKIKSHLMSQKAAAPLCQVSRKPHATLAKSQLKVVPYRCHVERPQGAMYLEPQGQKYQISP